MALHPGPQVSLGRRGQTINVDSWPWFNGLIEAVCDELGVDYDDMIVEATRPRSRQLYLYNGYVQGRIDPSTGRKFNPAYHPDSNSAYHVAGDAVDFGCRAGTRGSPVQLALHRLGPKFGIFFEVSNELWHGRRDPRRTPSTLPASSGATPIENEDDMTPEQDRKLTYLYEVMALSGPDNNGTPLVKQIGGAFRDSAAAMNAAKNAEKSSQFAVDVLFNGGSDMPDGGRPLAQSIAGIVSVVDKINATVNRVIKRDTKAVVTPAGDLLELSQADDDVQANTGVRKLLDHFKIS
jgi:hypothetical protein